MVVSNIFYFYPYLGKISNLTNIFEKGLKPPTSSIFIILLCSSQHENIMQFFFVESIGGVSGTLEKRSPVLLKEKTKISLKRNHFMIFQT